MRKIYRRALQVTVWLGPADDISDSVIYYLAELGRNSVACGIKVITKEVQSAW